MRNLSNSITLKCDKVCLHGHMLAKCDKVCLHGHMLAKCDKMCLHGNMLQINFKLFLYTCFKQTHVSNSSFLPIFDGRIKRV